MTRRDLAFVHLHRPVKAAYLKAIVRAALERDPDKRIPGLFTSDISRIDFRTGISRGDHSNPDLPRRLGRDYRVPQDSRDEALDRAAEVAPIVRAAQSKRGPPIYGRVVL